MTDRAGERIRELIAVRAGEYYLRLLARRSGALLTYHLMFEPEARPTDQQLTRCGVRLLVDPASATIAEGCTIDYLQSAGGFAVYNPTAHTGT